MQAIKEQLSKDNARRNELLPKLVTLKQDQKRDWNGTTAEQILGYEEEISIIKVNENIYDEVLDWEALGTIEHSISIFEGNKTTIDLWLKVQTKIQDEETVRLAAIQRSKGIEDSISDTEERIYFEMQDREKAIPVYKGKQRAHLLCLRELRRVKDNQ